MLQIKKKTRFSSGLLLNILTIFDEPEQDLFGKFNKKKISAIIRGQKMKISVNHRILFKTILIICIFFSFEIVFGKNSDVEKNRKQLEEKIDAYVRPYLKTGDFSGCILIAKSGEVLLGKSYGFADQEKQIPNTPQTKFHLASASKPFTTAAIMLLEERGLLKVTDLVTKFIPDFRNGDKITIHHLMIHSSGISTAGGLSHLWGLFRGLFKRSISPESLVAPFKNQDLMFEPGARYSYNNANYNLLAYIVELVSGKEFGTFLNDNIFSPLSMYDSGHDTGDGSQLKQSARGYAPLGLLDVEQAPSVNWTTKTGSGSLYSTIEDMHKWDRALHKGNLLKQSSLDQIFKNHLAGSGYGWFTVPHLNRERVYINGRSPGFSSYHVRYIKDELTIIILNNMYNSLPTPMGKDIAAILFDEPYEIPQFSAAKSRREIIDAIVGTYQFGPDFYRPNGSTEIFERDGNLYTPQGGLLSLPNEMKFIYRKYWSTLTFVRGENGKVSHVIFDTFKGIKEK